MAEKGMGETPASEAAPNVTVLVVEDNPGDARLAEILLDSKPGRFHVETAERLSTALARLGRGGVDVVLLDLNLPDSQGLDTFLRVQVRAPWLPIVVLSGLEDEEIGLLAVQQGAQDYLVKGHLSAEQLTRAISYAIERKRVEEDLIRK